MPADAEEARRAAEQVLTGPEYREAATPWWQEALERIDAALGRLVGSLGGSGGSAVVGWVVVVVVVGVAAAVVVLAVRSLRGSRRLGGDGEEATTTHRRRRPEADRWDLDAEDLEREGRWREGLRARYRDLVVVLSERRVVDPAASRTTGEHRVDVGAAAPDAAGDFGDAAELFDRAWYGNRPTGRDEAERFARLADRIGASTRAGGPGTGAGEGGR